LLPRLSTFLSKNVSLFVIWRNKLFGFHDFDMHSGMRRVNGILFLAIKALVPAAALSRMSILRNGSACLPSALVSLLTEPTQGILGTKAQDVW
jgi:hypothetical protein